MENTLDIDIKSMNHGELKELCQSMGLPAFREKQLFSWLHGRLARDYAEMTNLPEELRRKLAEEYPIRCCQVEKVQTSRLDDTSKYLFRLFDGNLIESVLMHYHHGNSVCISSQVGCRMGCRFCASTIDGVVRNLTASEMLDQIYMIQLHTGQRVDNVVVMGSGEPLDNYDNLIRFIELLNDRDGLNISARSITVSTCGIVPEIRRLADRQVQITLAVSLHAPNDELRRTMMPIANKYSISEVLDACAYYLERTGRRLTFEYSLVQGVNDSDECADELARLVRGLNCHVNLIPVNPIKERDYRQATRERVQHFKGRLERLGINCTVRREMGRDIDGACGQLRRSYMQDTGA
jgi:23S rRNA (adenine2503-C2)-methyltransferase